MARRIAIAILLTVWATLIVGGVGAYLAVRSVMLHDLDNQLVHSARQVPEVEVLAGDVSWHEARYVMLDDNGKRLSSSSLIPPHAPDGEIRAAQFVELPEGGGRRFRSLTIRFPLEGGKWLTVIYGEPTDHFDAVLRRLALGLAAAGLVAGIAAAGVAVAASRMALRPLRETAGTIGAIDESRLDRRIDGGRLPPELRPTATTLNEMLARLEASFARRKQFLADASHELRTPVAALVTTLEVALRRPREAAELTATLESCLGDARLLRRMVQALLEHARGESRPPEAEPVDVVALLDEAVRLVAPLAEERGLTCVRSYTSYSSVAPVLVADRRRLISVVTNLLSNAVEYNRPAGTIEVSLSPRAPSAPGFLEIAVRDTGRGIATEHLPGLFEPFYRAGRGGAEDVAAADHLGLGLFLVQSHAHAMGGRVRVESTLGIGTAFYVLLPITTLVADATASTVEPGRVEALPASQERVEFRAGASVK